MQCVVEKVLELVSDGEQTYSAILWCTISTVTWVKNVALLTNSLIEFDGTTTPYLRCIATVAVYDACELPQLRTAARLVTRFGSTIRRHEAAVC